VDGGSVRNNGNRGGLDVELQNVATWKDGKTLEDSNVSRLGLAISDGMKKEGLKEEEELPKGLGGCLVGRVIC
jgi:hypothetical protein